MNLSSITLLVTGQCNFDCVYCYQRRRNKHMDYAAAEKALVFFCPI